MIDRSKGVLFMVLAALAFALSAASVKLAGDLPLMQKVFVRNLFAFFVALYIMIKNKESFKGNNLRFLTLRSVLGLLGVILNFFAISNLVLADANILNNTSPFFVIVFSFIFLKEPIKKVQIPTLLFAFLGAILVIKPQFNYTIIPSILGLAGGMFAGAAYATVRHLRNSDTPQTIVFYFSFISIIVATPFLLIGHYASPTPIQWLGLIGIGIFSTAAQFLITHAYRFAPAGELSIYNYAQILFTLLLGLIFWNEVPDFLSILGGILIVAAGYINYSFSKDPTVKI